MARDYVALRQTGTEAEPDWTESWVGRALLKSAPARVVRTGDSYRIEGATWGAPIGSVEVKLDEGSWQRVQLDRSQQDEAAWVFWTLTWANLTPGEHSITTRAVDTKGNIQPAQDDPWIANKLTYWESNGQITRRVKVLA
jgi:hypothetical protein